MIYNYSELKITYLRLPKTASTSLMKAFFSSHTLESDNEIKFKSFTVVRNPYDRFLSAISMFTKNMDEPFARIYNGREKPEELNVKNILSLLDIETDKLFYWKKSFKYHINPMTCSFYHANQADKVFKYEDFPKAWEDIANFIGVDTPVIPHKKKSLEKIILTQKDKDLIYSYFEKDFITFGYER